MYATYIWLKKLPKFIGQRRKNAEYFVELFSEHPFLHIQKEIGSSSWFGFSLILKEKSPISRSDLVGMLVENEIECRPIVTGNFLKNVEVLKYFDYEISGTLENADYIDKQGLFVGNHHVCIKNELDYLFDTLKITSA